MFDLLICTRYLKLWTVCISPIIPKIQSQSCRPIGQMKMYIYRNILPKFVRSATIYCRVMASYVCVEESPLLVTCNK